MATITPQLDDETIRRYRRLILELDHELQSEPRLMYQRFDAAGGDQVQDRIRLSLRDGAAEDILEAFNELLSMAIHNGERLQAVADEMAACVSNRAVLAYRSQAAVAALNRRDDAEFMARLDRSTTKHKPILDRLRDAGD